MRQETQRFLIGKTINGKNPSTSQLYTNYMANIFLCRFDSKIIPLDFIWPHKLFLDWRFHLHYCVLSFENTNSPVYYISQQEV